MVATIHHENNLSRIFIDKSGFDGVVFATEEITRMKISQREARRLRKRNRELEQILEEQQSRWNTEWPCSKLIGDILPGDGIMQAVRTARILNHAVVVVPENAKLRFFALELKG